MFADELGTEAVRSSPGDLSDVAVLPSSEHYHDCEYPLLPIDQDYLLSLALPGGFTEMATISTLSYRTIGCVRRLIGRNGFESKLDVFEPLSSSFVDFWEACSAVTLRNDPLGQPPLEKLICLAMICYCLNCVEGKRPTPRCYAHNMTLELKQQPIPGHGHTTILTEALQ
jgi:hypothetical protein